MLNILHCLCWANRKLRFTLPSQKEAICSCQKEFQGTRTSLPRRVMHIFPKTQFKRLHARLPNRKVSALGSIASLGWPYLGIGQLRISANLLKRATR
jgi:hypothetical protein